MKILFVTLALASLAAAPAFAKVSAQRGPQAYMFPFTGPGTQVNPPGVMVRGKLNTDPDPQVRTQLHRGYDVGPTD